MRSNEFALGALLLSVVAIIISLGFYTSNRPQPQIVGTALPAGSAVFETSLQDRITSSDTSLTLVSTSTASGEALPTGYHCFAIDEGRTDAEFVCGTLGGNKQVTSLERGLSYVTGTTTVAANKFSHRKGANVKISDYPLIQRMRSQLNGTDTIPNLMTYADTVLIGVGSPTSTVTTKYYVDSVAVAGASNADNTTKGIVEMATAAEAAAGTSAGATGARLAIGADLATSTPTASCSAFCVVVAAAGKIAQGFIDLTTTYLWSGLHTFSAGFLSTASSTVNAVFTVTGNTTINPGILSISTTTGTSTLAGHLQVSGNATTTNLTVSGTCTGCLEGYERIETGGAMGTNNTQTTTIDANCTSGNRVIGGGYDTPNDSTFLADTDGYTVTKSYAFDNDTWRTVFYCATSGSCDSGYATTTAVCVRP